MLVQTLQAEVRTLLGQGLFQSAVTLCHFVLSSTATWAEKLESLTLYGSALLGCDEYQRALCVFLQVQVLVKNASVSDQARFSTYLLLLSPVCFCQALFVDGLGLSYCLIAQMFNMFFVVFPVHSRMSTNSYVLHQTQATEVGRGIIGVHTGRASFRRVRHATG